MLEWASCCLGLSGSAQGFTLFPLPFKLPETDRSGTRRNTVHAAEILRITICRTIKRDDFHPTASNEAKPARWFRNCTASHSTHNKKPHRPRVIYQTPCFSCKISHLFLTCQRHICLLFQPLHHPSIHLCADCLTEDKLVHYYY